MLLIIFKRKRNFEIRELLMCSKDALYVLREVQTDCLSMEAWNIVREGPRPVTNSNSYGITPGQAVAQLLQALCYKPEGSGVEFRWGDFFIWPNPSSHTTAPVLTQPPTEMVPGIFLGRKGRPAHRTENLIAICVPIV
jgi:hypothetical protein